LPSSKKNNLLPQVTDIREYLDQANPLEPENILVTRTADGPLLLDGSETPTDLEAILSDIPPQDITNKLVSRYFNGVEFPSGTSSDTLVMIREANEVTSDNPHTHIRSRGMSNHHLHGKRLTGYQHSIAISG
jgi:hypothetical protein